MKWVGSKVIQLDTVKLPAGFAKRKKEPHVKELAKSIQRGGVISLPVVRAKPRDLVAGGDRLAALMLLGITRHEVRLVEGTDQELRILTLEENVRRRRSDNYDAMTAELVELTGEQIEERRAEEPEELPANLTGNEEPEPRKAGRPKSAKGEARELVAAATGRTPEAVRQAEKRAKAEEKASEEPAAGVPMPAPVDTFDVELAESVMRDLFPNVRVVQETLREAGKKVDASLRLITLNLKNGPALSMAAFSRTWQAVHDAADAIRRATPESVCPWCKCQLHRFAACNGCGGTGFVSGGALEGIAPELLERGPEAKVPTGFGGFESATGPKGGAPKNKPAKGARKLRFENESGQELTPIEEEPIF
jgi:ParB-like chromosome segregation protein Spo0J